ncbi:hypothetical protein GCM10027598_12340 [Amycolatopsis oliviviridis]|uniref:Uncharacterized protein n=1 Tax=Amycolatopsis oliviviridis TaxID=1471590 RepID=A0ABQ3LWH8_9PSEU|nr:hypothetical protein GCM10017790_53800 [Amycolatopsis oliviviridis]
MFRNAAQSGGPDGAETLVLGGKDTPGADVGACTGGAAEHAVAAAPTAVAPASLRKFLRPNFILVKTCGPWRGCEDHPAESAVLGFSKSKRLPASHSDRWFPYAGIPPARCSMEARCSRFQVMKAVFRLVKSFSGPPEPSSR